MLTQDEFRTMIGAMFILAPLIAIVIRKKPHSFTFALMGFVMLFLFGNAGFMAWWFGGFGWALWGRKLGGNNDK